jgi:hypothetical protein
MLCNECPKRDKCKTLCKEAEEYANQDYVPKTINTFSELGIDSPDEVFSNEDTPWDMGTTKYSNILYLYSLGYKITKIAELLQVSHQYVSKVIKSAASSII